MREPNDEAESVDSHERSRQERNSNVDELIPLEIYS